MYLLNIFGYYRHVLLNYITFISDYGETFETQLKYFTMYNKEL